MSWLLASSSTSFAGGSTWAFDIPRAHLGGAQQIAATLTATGRS
jgi:hypothetical protein